MERQFLSRKEFAAATGVQILIVAMWIKNKTIVATKVGGRILIPIEEIERLKKGGTA